ncbi:hypothetical protein CC86DRAFT_403663 [Ophiobolus disseminans]|uniref:Hydrophobin n=1 Tax=Ophiobolus disseminans TaxID=1469910 RepID=A0A6A7A6V8_9PLEO|nr:hypothetical protein CC86DRAFT_403663 [Ophiobolus disseminans]
MQLTLLTLFPLFVVINSSPAPLPDAEGSVQLDARQSFGSCYVSGRGAGIDGAGTCRYNTGGACVGVSVSGFCPGQPSNIQCCRSISCYSPYQSNINFCRNTYKGCGGVFVK